MKPCRASFRFLGPSDDTIPEQCQADGPLGVKAPKAGRRASSAFNSPSQTPLDSATTSGGVTPATSSVHDPDESGWTEIQSEAAMLIKAAKRQALKRRSKDLGLNSDDAAKNNIEVREDDPFWIDQASRRRSSASVTPSLGSQRNLRSRSRSSSTHLGENLLLSESGESDVNDRKVVGGSKSAEVKSKEGKDCEVLKVSLDIPRTYSWCN